MPKEPTNAHHSTTGFSPTQFRDAMGPGYQVATFRDQPILIGETRRPATAAFPVTPRRQTDSTRRIALRRRPGRWVHLPILVRWLARPQIT